jgi:hypothetical protein
MTSRSIVELTDDIDGSQATETVSFGLDGVAYEIDVNGKNAVKFRKTLERYVIAARRVRARTKRRARDTQAGSSDSRVIREWATAHGIEVSTRGRISHELTAQYHAAAQR